MKKKLIAIALGALFISGVAQADLPNKGINSEENKNMKEMTVEDFVVGVGMSFNEAFNEAIQDHQDLVQRLTLVDLDNYDFNQLPDKNLKISELIAEHAWTKEVQEQRNKIKNYYNRDKEKRIYEPDNNKDIQEKLDKIRIQELDIEILENELKIKRLEKLNKMAEQGSMRKNISKIKDDTVKTLTDIKNKRIELVKDLSPNT